MSLKNTNHMTRGGQVWAHQIRMGLQVGKNAALLAVLPSMLVLGVRIVKEATFQAFYFCGVAWWCDLKLSVSKVFSKGEGLITFNNGEDWVTWPAREFLNHPYVQERVESAEMGLSKLVTLEGWFWTLVTFGICFGFSLWYFCHRGRRMEEERFVEGKQMKSVDEVAKAVKKKGGGAFSLTPDLPLPQNVETKHMMVLGTTGAGKTNCLLGLLNQVREKGQRAVILDTNGGYVNRYYDLLRGDIILNPFDTRSKVWTLWEDCKTTSDFDQFATALIPEPKGGENPVWHKNAREIISTTAEKLALQGEYSMRRLIDLACWKPLERVKEFYFNTPVESLMLASGKAAEVVHSVRLQMTDAMKRLSLLPEEGEGFSVAKWVTQGKGEGWLFVSCTEADRSSLGTLMKFWVNLAIQSLLKRGEDPDHRLWFVLDELFSLEGGSVDELYTLLREGRKYGGCGVLGFQSLAGLETAYGYSGMRDAVSLCNTKVVFQTPEPNTAGYIAQCLGEKEIIQSNESLSMGANTIRDGVNLTGQQRRKTTVSKTDIMELTTGQAFVSLAGDFPVCKAVFPLNSMEMIHCQEDFQRWVNVLGNGETGEAEALREEQEDAAQERVRVSEAKSAKQDEAVEVEKVKSWFDLDEDEDESEEHGDEEAGMKTEEEVRKV